MPIIRIYLVVASKKFLNVFNCLNFNCIDTPKATFSHLSLHAQPLFQPPVTMKVIASAMKDWKQDGSDRI